MFRFAKWLPCLAMLAGAVMFGTASPVYAAFQTQLTLTETGFGSPVVVTGTDSAAYSGNVGTHFVISSASGDTFLSTPTNALTEAGAITIVNTDTTAAHDLTITVTATGFGSPLSPPALDLLDSVSGTLLRGSVSGTAQGFAGTGNTLNEQTVQGAQLSFSASGGSKTFAGVLDGTVPNAFSPTSAYSLTFIEKFTLSAGGAITVTGGNVQIVSSAGPNTHPVPAPASAVMAFTALPLLGLGAWLRRRKVTLLGA